MVALNARARRGGNTAVRYSWKHSKLVWAWRRDCVHVFMHVEAQQGVCVCICVCVRVCVCVCVNAWWVGVCILSCCPESTPALLCSQVGRQGSTQALRHPSCPPAHHLNRLCQRATWAMNTSGH